MDRGWQTCPQPGCPALTRGGPCDTHKARPGHSEYDARWAAFAATYLITHPRCVRCRLRPATEVDHIKPLRMGGAKYALPNLRAVCHACHVTITAETRSTPQRSRKVNRR